MLKDNILKEFIKSSQTEDEYFKTEVTKDELITLRSTLKKHEEKRKKYYEMVLEPTRIIEESEKSIKEIHFSDYFPAREDKTILTINTTNPNIYYRFIRTSKGEYLFATKEPDYKKLFLNRCSEDNINLLKEEFDKIYNAWQQTGYDYIRRIQPLFSVSKMFLITLEKSNQNSCAELSLLRYPKEKYEYSYSKQEFKREEYNQLLDKIMIKKLKK